MVDPIKEVPNIINYSLKSLDTEMTITDYMVQSPIKEGYEEDDELCKRTNKGTLTTSE